MGDAVSGVGSTSRQLQQVVPAVPVSGCGGRAGGGMWRTTTRVTYPRVTGRPAGTFVCMTRLPTVVAIPTADPDETACAAAGCTPDASSRAPLATLQAALTRTASADPEPEPEPELEPQSGLAKAQALMETARSLRAAGELSLAVSKSMVAIASFAACGDKGAAAVARQLRDEVSDARGCPSIH